MRRVAAAWALVLAAAGLVAWLDRGADTGDLGFFVAAGRTLVSGDRAQTFADPAVQAGPLQLGPLGLADHVAGWLGVSTLGLLSVTISLVGTAAILAAASLVLRGRPWWVAPCVGAAAVVLGLPRSAFVDGHPAQLFVPLLWLVAAQLARRGRVLPAGALVGLSAGLETWGLLGVDSEPTEAMTFNVYGITDFEVQYWNGTAWAAVPSGSVTGNNKVWRKFTFDAITTNKIRVVVNNALNNYSRIVEIEAWTAPTSGAGNQLINAPQQSMPPPPESYPATEIRWMVTDQLGTPRMIFDQSGALAKVSRHDYFPFGEELFVGTGGRTAAEGYMQSDGLRQKFTQKERDNETGLDYFINRYYSSTQGRFTGVDPLMASAQASLPQSWNRYSYSFNNPLAFIDPDGRRAVPDDYYADRDGQITIDETGGTTDSFYVQNADGTYTQVATLQRNDAGLVQFPGNGTGFNRYGTVDAGGHDRATGENVGQGDHFLQPVVAAALFGTINVVNSDHQLTVSLGDMSSSNGSDPWQPGGQHHAGHGHRGNRSGLDIDFRYLNNNGVSFQSPTARSDPQFSVQNNQTLYDTARAFGFTTNYQGTNPGNNGEIRGVTRAGGHNDHGHLGFNQANANIFRRSGLGTRP